MSRTKGDDLTRRQIALLLAVGLDPEPHILSNLVVRLGVSRGAVARDLDRLGELGYMERVTNPDQRALVIRLTEQGRLYLAEFTESLQRSRLH